MHFISRSSAICVAALSIGIFFAHAQQDTPAQIKAREALRQTMKALEAQDTNQPPTAAQSPAPAPTPSPAATTSVSPAPVSSPPASGVFSTPPPGSGQMSADSEAIAKARATLRQKMAELDAQAAQANTVAAAPKPVSKSKSSAAPAKVITTETTPAAEKTELKPKEAAKPTPPKVMSARGLPPIESPAPTISAAKQQQLQELLQLYQADKISPRDYHDQRAKILAEP
jgi:hypothetical protein